MLGQQHEKLEDQQNELEKQQQKELEEQQQKELEELQQKELEEQQQKELKEQQKELEEQQNELDEQQQKLEEQQKELKQQQQKELEQQQKGRLEEQNDKLKEKKLEEEEQEELNALQVESALRSSHGSDAHLESWSTEGFTSKGDHYMCTIRRINVTFSLDGRKDHVSYVAKIKQGIPDGLNSFGDMGFAKECLMYGTIIPALNGELSSRDLRTLRLPHCYLHSLEQGKEVVILEDLNASGFKMANRQEGLDEAQAKLVVWELARLHAASILHQATLPSTNLALHYPLLQKDWLNYSEKAESELGVVLKSDIIILASVAEGAGRPKSEVVWLQELVTKTKEVFSQQLTTAPPFAVLCHGDCWTNNFLFRYDSEGGVDEIRLLDVQLCRRGSVALDLNTLMYSSLSGQVRRAGQHALLHEYHRSFSQVFQACNTAVPFTLEELVAEYYDKSLFGLLMGADYLPVVMVEAKDAPDYNLISSGEQDFIQHRDANLTQVLHRNPHLTDALLCLLDDMTELGVIPAHS